MTSRKKLIVSHAPFWHNGSSVTARHYNILAAALPAVFFGWSQYGMPAVGVVCLSVSSAVFWEYLLCRVLKRPSTAGDGNAALIGLMLAMLLPATMPWWAVLTGTFLAVVVGKMIFGGIGANAFNPAALAFAILSVSWTDLLDFNQALLTYDLGFPMVYPLFAVKNFGASAAADFGTLDLLMGRQTGGIGATFGIGLILGGVYLMVRGITRWEVSLSFIAGTFVTASVFNMADPSRFADPMFHVFAGNTLIGAFFLATEDSSSPVNFIPMLIYGAAGGFVAVMIRNIGVYVDGVILAILVINMLNPLVDKIRPKALGKVA